MTRVNKGPNTVQDKKLADCHILIIEDDFYQAQDTRDYLMDAGAQIAACRGTIPDLDELLAERRVEIAMLDINLGHTQSFDLARALRDRAIPFVFLTGYDAEIVPPDLGEAPLITKPADPATVINALSKRLEGDGPDPRETPD